MAEFTSHSPGTPSWVDLMTSDVDAAKAFYAAVFGWHFEDQFDDDGNRIYVMASLDGKSVAGMGAMPPGSPEGMPSVWNTYITVDDVDAAAAKVTEGGGTVMMPSMQIMTSGTMAVFADPTGAAFSVWKPQDHIGIELGNVANTLTWNELMSRDIDISKAFYAEVFGWTYETGEAMPDYNLIAGGNGGLGGLMAMPAEVPDMVPSHWVGYFAVADLEASSALVTENGGQMVTEAMSAPGVGSFATVHDPTCLLYTSPSPRDQRGSRMPSSA